MKAPHLSCPRTPEAFTLVELLCVIAIIGVLAAFTVDIVKGVTDKARQVACAQNLQQIFVMVNSAATDNDNRFPKIDADPDNAYYGAGEAKSLYATLKPYGCTERALQCPADMADPKSQAFTKHGTSYMWQPYAGEEPTNRITLYRGRGMVSVPPSRVQLCTDWNAIHPPTEPGRPNRMNVLYADGHVNMGLNNRKPR